MRPARSRDVRETRRSSMRTGITDRSRQLRGRGQVTAVVDRRTRHEGVRTVLGDRHRWCGHIHLDRDLQHRGVAHIVRARQGVAVATISQRRLHDRRNRRGRTKRPTGPRGPRRHLARQHTGSKPRTRVSSKVGVRTREHSTVDQHRGPTRSPRSARHRQHTTGRTSAISRRSQHRAHRVTRRISTRDR